MWARIATRYPVWHEIEPFALYRTHPHSNTDTYMRTGENLRDLGRLFSIIEAYVPNGRGRMLAKQGRNFYARDALGAAAGAVTKGNFSRGFAQAQRAVCLNPTLGVVWPLFRFACLMVGHGVRRLFGK